jgi:hypothetical protein
MLPRDTKKQKEASSDSSKKTQQSDLGDHFGPPDADIIPYSDRVFEAAAIEWLIHTNQVCFNLVDFLLRSDFSCFS